MEQVLRGRDVIGIQLLAGAVEGSRCMLGRHAHTVSGVHGGLGIGRTATMAEVRLLQPHSDPRSGVGLHPPDARLGRADESYGAALVDQDHWHGW